MITGAILPGSARREYALREQTEPKGPRVRLIHLASQAARHEFTATTFDFPPRSIVTRREARERGVALAASTIGS